MQAESARNQAQADLQAAEQALKVLGVEPDGLLKAPVSPEVPVLAPINGELVERLVGPGQVVQAGATQVFTISNMSTVWVLANVYEHDLRYVHVGDPVAIQTDAYAATFRGRIISYSFSEAFFLRPASGARSAIRSITAARSAAPSSLP